MTTIVHCADLHLSVSERDYSLSVFTEILELVRRVRASHLLICGDLFDSFDDAETLRTDLREQAESIADTCTVLYVPGNHEELRRGQRSLSSLDLGRVRLCATPFEVIQHNGVEFLCIPHQLDYSGYHQETVPAKKEAIRIALAHGLVSGMDVYAGPVLDEEQEKAVAIDPDLFTRFEVDYAALGHIHRRLGKRNGATEMRYAGSSRVWRQGEVEERGVNVLTLGNQLSAEFVPLRKAGQYRRYDVPLGLDGTYEGLDTLAGNWSEPDWIDLHLTGLVEDENAVAEFEQRIRQQYGPGVRRLTVDREQVRPLPGILEEPIARTFLGLWQQQRPSEPDEETLRAYFLAREVGLREIATAMENREC
jgi:exonuclease SbcD